ncbi:MAG: hypothetical protein HQK51_12940 [Oligoflexia bacterium]|nr:hypothetical protein [Oligoflexia bacterium]
MRLININTLWKYFLLLIILLLITNISSILAKEQSGSGNTNEKIVFNTIWYKLYGNYPEDGKSEKIEKKEEKIEKKEKEKEKEKEDEAKSKSETKTGPQLQPNGKKYVNDALERNRQLLRERDLKEKNERLEKEENAIKEGDEENDYRSFSSKMRRDVDNQLSKWKEDVAETYKHWAEERKKFLERVDVYKKNQIDFNQFESKNSNLKNIKSEMKKAEVIKNNNDHYSNSDSTNGKYHIVKDAFLIPIRDQGDRSTCSAFMGVRALEILSKQLGYNYDLSEQYFYWASRKDCQTIPCSLKGSWVTPGFDYSKEKGNYDIPLENYCPYENNYQQGNETQIPLKDACKRGGVVSVADYKLINSPEEIVEAINEDKPVMGGFRLNEDFYNNDGLVLSIKNKNSDSSKARMDQHAKGHAMLIIGYMELPKEKRKDSRDKYCFLTANSWGEGFGSGGYTCLSQKWIIENRLNNSFVVLESIKVR